MKGKRESKSSNSIGKSRGKSGKNGKDENNNFDGYCGNCSKYGRRAFGWCNKSPSRSKAIEELDTSSCTHGTAASTAGTGPAGSGVVARISVRGPALSEGCFSGFQRRPTALLTR